LDNAKVLVAAITFALTATQYDVLHDGVETGYLAATTTTLEEGALNPDGKLTILIVMK